MLISLTQVTNVKNKVVKVRMYQSGQAKLHNRYIGEVAIPLPLVQVLQPVAESPTTESAAAGAKDGSGGGEESKQQQHRPSLSSGGGGGGDGGGGKKDETRKRGGSFTGSFFNNQFGSLSGSTSTTLKEENQKKKIIDPVLLKLIQTDEILSTIHAYDIPEPSFMPLEYSWEKGDEGKYREKNGEIKLALWMIPVGGSLFGDIEESDVVSVFF